ncbi:hypothetical protein Leryth_000678 [Lithospermum erythrorhizon]|nr:hypothetical protein Leryth_000678 [Lithospermum erythrorhizon]
MFQCIKLPLPPSPPVPHPPDPLEFNESDIFNPPPSPDFRTPISNKKMNRKYSTPASRVVSGGGSASVPVNVPDWSKILKEEYGGKRWSSNGDNEDDEESDDDGMGALVA